MIVYGLIGKSLLHSRSSEYFRNKFIRENINDVDYQNIPLEDLQELPELIRKTENLAGLNVTNPYKIDVLKFLTGTDPVARKIGAVNCIKIIRQGKRIDLLGYNTDAEAFGETLKPLLRKDHKRALVLGTGGASKAVIYSLERLNIAFTLVSRQNSPGKLNYMTIDQQLICEHQLIINATPLGMHPEISGSPSIPYQALTPKHLLYDLVYNPEMTQFLKKGLAVGAQIKNGLEMLHLQAELSWKTWNSSKFKVQIAK